MFCWINFNLNYAFIFPVQRSNNAKYCPLDCQAGGTCVYVGSTAKCYCSPGRTGRLCEIRMFFNFLNFLLFIFWFVLESGNLNQP